MAADTGRKKSKRAQLRADSIVEYFYRIKIVLKAEVKKPKLASSDNDFLTANGQFLSLRNTNYDLICTQLGSLTFLPYVIACHSN